MTSLKQHLYRALRKSEDLFKTDMVYLAKGGFWLTLMQFAVALSSFVLSIVFARLFQKDAYGTYKYIITLSGIISSISLTGLGTAVAQSAARGFGGALKEGFKENLRWSTGVFVISILGALYYALNQNWILSISFVIISFSLPFLNSGSLFNSYLNGTKKFKELAYLMVLRNTLPSIVLIISLLYSNNLVFIIFMYFTSHTLSSLLVYFLTKKLYTTNKNTDTAMVSYAKHLSLLSILNTVADQIDKVIVYHYVGAVELAVYTFATALPMQVKGVLKGVYSLALPKFSIRSKDELRDTLTNKMFKFFLIIVPIVVLYILSAPYLYKIFFPQYLDAVRISQIFALSLLPFISTLPSTVLQAQKSVKTLYQVNLIFAMVKIILLFIGVAVGGFMGLVFARVGYEYVGLAIVYFYTRRALNT